MRTLFAAAAAIVAAMTFTATPALADSSPAATPQVQGQACDGASGVSVVVDYKGLDGRDLVQVACAAGTPADGMVALGAVETITTQYGGGFVCTIDGSPEDGQCTTDGYWGLWTADSLTAAEWTSASVGAGDLHPAAGSVEAFTWNADPTAAPAQPSVLPAALATAGVSDGTANSSTATATGSPSASSSPGVPTNGPSVNASIIALIVLLVAILAGVATLAVARSRGRSDDADE